MSDFSIGDRPHEVIPVPDLPVWERAAADLSDEYIKYGFAAFALIASEVDSQNNVVIALETGDNAYDQEKTLDSLRDTVARLKRTGQE